MLRRSGVFAKMMILTVMASGGSYGYGLGLPGLQAEDESLGGNGRPSARSFDFSGIVALDNCSGSIVRFEHSQDDDKALVMTNGHCVMLLDAGAVLVDRPSQRVFTLLDADANSLAQLQAERLVYATMTGTDLALYQLTMSYRDIRQQYQSEALVLSREAGEAGTPIEVLSGYWRRGYACEIDAIVPTLKEDRWTWIDSIRYSRSGCNTIGGTSGSPIVEANTRTVIGVNNTNNTNGEECTMHNPCEVTSAGDVYAEKGLSYGQQTVWIYSCLNGERKLDLQLAGCALPKA